MLKHDHIQRCCVDLLIKCRAHIRLVWQGWVGYCGSGEWVRVASFGGPCVLLSTESSHRLGSVPSEGRLLRLLQIRYCSHSYTLIYFSYSPSMPHWKLDDKHYTVLDAVYVGIGILYNTTSFYTLKSTPHKKQPSASMGRDILAVSPLLLRSWIM